MNEHDKLSMVKAMSGEANDEVVSAYLFLAGQKICRLAYPYDETVDEVPAKYAHVQVEAAVYMLNKRGAEFQTGHTENGISRQYESADFPDSMLRSIVPVARIVS